MINESHEWSTKVMNDQQKPYVIHEGRKWSTKVMNDQQEL